MKRSEMIKVMKHASATGPSAVNMDKYLSNILTSIEKTGMKPPRYIGVTATGKKYNKETDFGRDTWDFNDWEPEDEA